MKTALHFSALTLAASFVLSASASAGTLHVFTSDAAGFNTQSVWYDDGAEVTVVDAQFTPSHAEALLSDVKAHSASPVTRVIVTHPNPDKFNGLSAFHRQGVESIASNKTASAIPGVDAYKRNFWVNLAKVFTEASYPKVEPIKTTYTGKKVISLKSGETITLIELKQPGVSSNQTVVRIDKSGDLIVGDLVHTRHHAWLEGGIVDGAPAPNLGGWKSDLNELLRIGRGKVYGGRGEHISVKQAVGQQIAYLEKADAIVDAYLRRLDKRTGELSDPSKQDAHFKAIQAEFVLAFPDYAFPDLVSYSVYGLVQQKLANLRLRERPKTMMEKL